MCVLRVLLLFIHSRIGVAQRNSLRSNLAVVATLIIEKFFTCTKKSNLAAEATLLMARALQRAVVSTCRRFF